ncbi:MAG TPA: hypothetical protein VEI97_08035, partial [bacterium]|nr:hypothetical protein [bacterium]
ELLLADSEEPIWIEDTNNIFGFTDPFGNPVTVLPGTVNHAVEPPDTSPAAGFAFGFIPYAGWQMTDPSQTYFQPFYQKGEHEIDSLVEPWARHPENDSYYLASRSVDNRPLPANRDENGNVPAGDPDEYTVPERWVLPNVPIGMDDFSERTIRNQRERLDTGFEPLPGSGAFSQPSSPMPVDQPVPTGGGTPGQPEGLPLDDGANWAISPADPGHTATANRVDLAPRPASYFRNNSGVDNSIPDTLTYDATGDGVGAGDTNQYLQFPPLQQLVRASGWANVFFGGASGGPNDRRNHEYKPAAGAITRYEVGGSGGDQSLPGWYEAIVSDEASRFP